MIKDPNKKIEEILGSLDGVQRAEVPSFFYTRLKARMEKGQYTAPQKHWALRPVYALATLAIVILLNAVVLLKGQSQENNASETETYQSIAAEYNLNDSITEEVYK